MPKILILCLSILLPCVATAATYTFEGGPLSIPTSGPADPAFLYVEGVEGVVTNITFQINGISHYYGRETMLALANPNGYATLIWDAPSCVFESADITISDAATEDIGQACDNNEYLSEGVFTPGFMDSTNQFTIPIAPIRPLFLTLADLILENPNGRWILWSEDFVGGDGGDADSWQLIIETQDAL